MKSFLFRIKSVSITCPLYIMIAEFGMRTVQQLFYSIVFDEISTHNHLKVILKKKKQIK
jgi:hypothetical protein